MSNWTLGPIRPHPQINTIPCSSVSKEYACSAGDLGFNPWVGKMPWRRKGQSTPVSLSGKSHGQRSLVGCSPWGRKELGTTERLTLTYFLTHHLRGFPAGSVVKESACHAGDLCSTPESGRSPWRREWLLNPVFLRGESHGQRSLVGCSSWGCKKLDKTE